MPRRRMISKQLIRFEEGVSYVGTLTVKERQTINEKEIGRYELDGGAVQMVVNGTVQLDEAMAHAEVGQMIEIVYLGEASTASGFKVKRFEVYVLTEEGEDNGKE